MGAPPCIFEFVDFFPSLHGLWAEDCDFWRVSPSVMTFCRGHICCLLDENRGGCDSEHSYFCRWPRQTRPSIKRQSTLVTRSAIFETEHGPETLPPPFFPIRTRLSAIFKSTNNIFKVEIGYGCATAQLELWTRPVVSTMLTCLVGHRLIYFEKASRLKTNKNRKKRRSFCLACRGRCEIHGLLDDRAAATPRPKQTTTERGQLNRNYH